MWRRCRCVAAFGCDCAAFVSPAEVFAGVAGVAAALWGRWPALFYVLNAVLFAAEGLESQERRYHVQSAGVPSGDSYGSPVQSVHRVSAGIQPSVGGEDHGRGAVVLGQFIFDVDVS